MNSGKYKDSLTIVIPVKTGKVWSILGIKKIRKRVTFRFCMFSWMEMADKAGLLPQELGSLSNQQFYELALWSAAWAADAKKGREDPRYSLEDIRWMILQMSQIELNKIVQFMIDSRIGGSRLSEIYEEMIKKAEEDKEDQEGLEEEPQEKKEMTG